MRLMFRSQVLVGDRVGAGKPRTGGQGEIRSPKSEKSVTTDYLDFTDLFSAAGAESSADFQSIVFGIALAMVWSVGV